MAKSSTAKTVETLKHSGDKRKNIPTKEYESVLQLADQKAVEKRYPRNTYLDPQLVWRGKDEQDRSDLVVKAAPLYIQEKVQPKSLIDDLLRATKERQHDLGTLAPDLLPTSMGSPKGRTKPTSTSTTRTGAIA